MLLILGSLLGLPLQGGDANEPEPWGDGSGSFGFVGPPEGGGFHLAALVAFVFAVAATPVGSMWTTRAVKSRLTETACSTKSM